MVSIERRGSSGGRNTEARERDTLTRPFLASFAQFERKLIGERTRSAMAAKRAAGLHMGRRSALPAPVFERIIKERRTGRTLQQIADGLNRDNTATGQGGKKWHSATVHQILNPRRQRQTAGAQSSR